jgi:hypothetical protein
MRSEHTIQALYMDWNGYRWLGRSGVPEAATTALASEHHVQLRTAFGFPKGTALELHILASINRKMQLQLFAFPRRSFNSQYPALRTNFSRSEQRVKSVMRAYIQNRHSRIKKSLHERAFRVLKPSTK